MYTWLQRLNLPILTKSNQVYPLVNWPFYRALSLKRAQRPLYTLKTPSINFEGVSQSSKMLKKVQTIRESTFSSDRNYQRLDDFL